MRKPNLFSVIDKAIYDYNMIENGDKILIGASGGKDSTSLLEYFANRQHRKGENFTFTAMHIETDFGSCAISPRLRELVKSWGIDLKNLFVNVQGRLKPGKKMNCYWCSTQRRTELLRYALDNGYTKLVLGHHMDDILETLLMNMLTKGSLSTMPPKFTYKKYPLTIIRPLCYADIKSIKEHAAEQGYISTTCTCTYQDNSGRKEARSKLEALTGGDKKAKEKLFASLRNIDSLYLP